VESKFIGASAGVEGGGLPMSAYVPAEFLSESRKRNLENWDLERSESRKCKFLRKRLKPRNLNKKSIRIWKNANFF
jgi:hypothetical protein